MDTLDVAYSYSYKASAEWSGKNIRENNIGVIAVLFEPTTGHVIQSAGVITAIEPSNGGAEGLTISNIYHTPEQPKADEAVVISATLTGAKDSFSTIQVYCRLYILGTQGTVGKSFTEDMTKITASSGAVGTEGSSRYEVTLGPFSNGYSSGTYVVRVLGSNSKVLKSTDEFSFKIQSKSSTNGKDNNDHAAEESGRNQILKVAIEIVAIVIVILVVIIVVFLVALRKR